MRKELPIDWLHRYSDSSEDYILRMLFPYQTGHYVEVGVWEAKNLSNTYIFYEMGWNGVLIEPVPVWGRKAHGLRPRDFLVQKAASSTTGKATLKLESGASSLEKDWTNNEAQTIEVPMDTLTNILQPFTEIRDNCDFCSLDVEGHERKVLEGNDFTKFKPIVWCIEGVRWNPFYRTHQEWEHILLENGYKLICHNLQNRFYGLISNEDIWKQAEKYNLGE